MNSEIPNVLKLVPMTVVKVANKQAEDNASSGVKDQTGSRASVVSASQEDSQISVNQQREEKTAESKKAESEASSELVKQAVDEGNNLLQIAKRNLHFKVDDATNELVVKIVDSESGELVRQIPTEEMLTFVKRMQELEGQQGSVLQDRA